MGGFGSGRSGSGRPTVESALSLDLYSLMRGRAFVQGATTSGTMTWSHSHSCEVLARVSYTATLGPVRGQVSLRWTATDWMTGEEHDREQWIELETRSQPVGGRRWWFVCPRRGHVVSKLYKPQGARQFASQRAHRLAYRSQRQSPLDRAVSQAFKLRRRLGADGGIGDDIEKPKGMRWRTFDRHMARIEAAEGAVDGHLAWTVGQILSRSERR